MKYIDQLLNKITMYRVVLYYLSVLIIAALVYGFFGVLPYSPFAILFSAAFITFVCWASDELFSWLLRVPKNIESVYITAFILTLIITPALPAGIVSLALPFWASVLAIGSKYFITFHKKHLFNPAAFGVLVTAYTLGGYASWWVGGNLPLLPFVLVGGLLVVRKVRRFDLVLSFVAAGSVMIVLTTLGSHPLATLEAVFLHTSLLFFAGVMLTEPATTPPTRPKRVAYGALVGVLFAPALHFSIFTATPELALILGNIFSFILSPKGRYTLTLKKIERTSQNTSEFIFESNRKINFKPGQYLEWMLPHKKPDSRGIRRYFTVASSPTEDTVALGVKFYEPASSYKQALASMHPGDTLTATQLAGDFTLPESKKHKLVFIAGGIGVTPFRSMVQYLLDTKDTRPAVLLYSNKTQEEVAYKELFEKARREIGLKVLYAITNEKTDMPNSYNGFINPELIAREVPDYKECEFFISGPYSSIVAFTRILSDMGVHKTKIRTDFFPGFA